MKMGSALFWGLLLIVLGLSLVFKIVFNVDFPLFRIFIAFLLIFLGIKFLVGSFGNIHVNSSDNDVIFGEKNYRHFDERKEYNVIFGKATYDFRDIELQNERKKINISTVFGGTEVKLRKDMPVKIAVESAFGGANLPNGNSAVFGSTYYESPGLDKSKPYLYIKADVVFGGLDVKLY
jgi:predicted membrane protein